MSILITGSNGFLGKSLVSNLSKFGVTTLSRTNADICFDLYKDNFKTKIEFETVIHAAGKAHVIPKNEKEEQTFYQINVEGTKNLVKNLKNVKNFIFISSVSVYGLEFGENIDENYPLFGETPYAKSKILAENILKEWSLKNNVNLLILRLPLLAGTNPPGNLGDMINAIKNNRFFTIGKGDAKRSVVLVDDISQWISNQFGKNGIYNITDNDHPTFKELEICIAKNLNKKASISLPKFVGKSLGAVGSFFNLEIVNTYKINKMINSLTFSSQKATNELDWNPRKVKFFYKF